MIDKVIKYSSRFKEEVNTYNSLNLYDINIHSENLLIPILNETFNLDLKNLNSTQKKNYPSIDLADFTRRTAFQITSTPINEKIYATIEKFFNHKLNNVITSLYVFIIGEKSKTYSQEKIDKLLSGSFKFDCKTNILDFDDLSRLITELSVEKIEIISGIFEREFSDVQIEKRKNKIKFGYANTEHEKLYLNLLQLEFPKQIFIADINIDENENLKRRNEWRIQKGWKPIKKFKNKEQLISEELISRKVYSKDWIQREGKLITFRNLYDNHVPYSDIIDRGTITPINCEEYYSKNEESLRVFKHLLRNTLIQDCFKIGLEWEPEKQILRFKNDRKNPKSMSVSWKGKNIATKTVISELRNKKEGHLICFRHLAFEPTFEYVDDVWYMTINSTWSFTNPSGHKKSRFEKDYLSGIKRMENNNTVCYFYKFWSYFLRYQDLLSNSNPIITFLPFEPFQFCPKVYDANWLPIRVLEEQSIVNESVVEMDKDLSLKLFDDED